MCKGLFAVINPPRIIPSALQSFEALFNFTALIVSLPVTSSCAQYKKC